MTDIEYFTEHDSPDIVASKLNILVSDLKALKDRVETLETS